MSSRLDASEKEPGKGAPPLEPVVSPFAYSEATLPAPGRRSRVGLWVGLGAALALAGGLGAVWLGRVLNDPLRTMEHFPCAKYFENYHALAGARFRAELRVEADLGWKEEVGRLMLFSTPNDNRPVAVLVPGALGNIHFVKGQTYLAELEVREGGIIYARSCKKN